MKHSLSTDSVTMSKAFFGIAQLRLVLAVAAGAMMLIAVSPQAEAQRWRDGEVRGCSRFGHGCVSGPIRQARYGLEVRLPGGTWIGCGGDCRDKLREQTVDFWDEMSSGKGGRRR